MFDATENDLQLWSEFNEKIRSEESNWLKILFGVVITIVFLVGMIGNLLTCIVIYTDKSMHTATNYYLFNLAVSDMIVTLAILIDLKDLFKSDNLFNYGYDEITCKVHFFLVIALWNHGILVMTALAVERYIAICYPLVLKSTPIWRRVGKVIVLIWLVAIAESLPELWTVNLTKTSKANICFTLPTYHARIVNGVLALVTFIIPLGTMVFVYTMIACKVGKMQETSSRDKVFNHRDNRSKVNKLIVALTLSFLVCWVPFFSVRLLIFVLDMKQLMSLDKWWSVLDKFSAINCWFSAVLNPLLFSLMSTKFRKALKASNMTLRAMLEESELEQERRCVFSIQKTMDQKN